MKLNVWWVIAIGSIALGAAGQVLLRIGVQTAGFQLDQLLSARNVVRVLTNGYILVGIMCFAISMVTWLGVISGRNLSATYPLVSLSYIFVAVASVFFLAEPLNWTRAMGILVIVAGVILLNLR